MLLTVLIAEDDPKMRRVLRKVAEEKDDIRVVGEATDGTEALVLFEELRPDVVFIDINLPGKDGVNLALAREIFDLDPWTCLVFITALDQYREEALVFMPVIISSNPSKWTGCAKPWTACVPALLPDRTYPD